MDEVGKLIKKRFEVADINRTHMVHFTPSERHRIRNWIDERQAEIERLQPRKGKWDYGTQCSVCGGTINPPKDRKNKVPFCPWCGADMRDGYKDGDGDGQGNKP